MSSASSTSLSSSLLPVGVGVGVLASASFTRGVEGITRKNESILLRVVSFSRFGADRDRTICPLTLAYKYTRKPYKIVFLYPKP
ncbi:hypothetical protein Hanom_Chr14g01313331 [Helianthus anomalus]